MNEKKIHINQEKTIIRARALLKVYTASSRRKLPQFQVFCDDFFAITTANTSNYTVINQQVEILKEVYDLYADADDIQKIIQIKI